jgi:hypothetical protein
MCGEHARARYLSTRQRQQQKIGPYPVTTYKQQTFILMTGSGPQCDCSPLMLADHVSATTAVSPYASPLVGCLPFSYQHPAFAPATKMRDCLRNQGGLPCR